MSDQDTVTRREFVKTAGGAIAGTSLFGVAPALGGQAAPPKRRYAIIGTGDRATSITHPSIAP